MATNKIETFGQLLNDLRRRLGEAQHRAYDEPIPWQEIATKSGVHPNNLLRWEKDAGRPGSINDVYALVDYFERQGVFTPADLIIFELAGFNVAKQIAWLWVNQHDPDVRQELDSLIEKVEKKRQQRGNPSPVFVQV